jgi:hypothetical protein
MDTRTEKGSAKVPDARELRADMFNKLTVALQHMRAYEAAMNAGRGEGDPLTNMAVAACEFVRAERKAMP